MRDDSASKALAHKHEDLSVIPNTRKAEHSSSTCNPSTEEAELTARLADQRAPCSVKDQSQTIGGDQLEKSPLAFTCVRTHI